MPIRLLLLLAVAAIEAIPLSLVAGLLAAWSLAPGATALPLWPLVAAVLLAFAVTRRLVRRRLAERRMRVLLALVGLAAAVGLSATGAALDHRPLLPHDLGLAVLMLAVLLFAWSRGTVLARDDLVFDAIYASFRRGLIVLFVALLLALNTAGTLARDLVGSGWGDVIVFFLAALCALSLARVEEERRRGAGPEGAPPVRGEWVLTLLGVTGAVLVIGLVLSSFLSPAAAALALAPLGRVADLLQWLLTPLILLLGALIDPLVRLLRPLLHRRPAPPAAPHGKTRTPDLQHLLGIHTSPASVAHVVLIVVAVLVACVALWYAFAERRRGAADGDADEERESLWSWGLLLAGLRALWRRIRDRVIPARAIVPPAASVAVAGESGVLSIRAIYRRLLAGAAALGLPRRGAETPHEYLSRLRGAVPASEKDVALLTALYARARYGPDLPDQRDVAAAREVWARLEPALQQPDGETPNER